MVSASSAAAETATRARCSAACVVGRVRTSTSPATASRPLMTTTWPGVGGPCERSGLTSTMAMLAMASRKTLRCGRVGERILFESENRARRTNPAHRWNRQALVPLELGQRAAAHAAATYFTIPCGGRCTSNARRVGAGWLSAGLDAWRMDRCCQNGRVSRPRRGLLHSRWPEAVCVSAPGQEVAYACDRPAHIPVVRGLRVCR